MFVILSCTDRNAMFLRKLTYLTPELVPLMRI